MLPGGDGFKAHQDQAAGWDDFISWSTSVAIFIDKSTKENGYLEVAYGLHKQGLLGKKWEPIEQLDLEYTGVPCNPGPRKGKIKHGGWILANFDIKSRFSDSSFSKFDVF